MEVSPASKVEFPLLRLSIVLCRPDGTEDRGAFEVGPLENGSPTSLSEK